MKMRSVLLISCVILLSSCAPKITTTISRQYSPLDYRQDVRVFRLQDAVPGNSEKIGIIKVGDTGFSTNCGWEVVIEKAKTEARKIGGNALKITQHTPPSIWGSSCHRITANVLIIADSVLSFVEPVIRAKTDSLINPEYATLHVYRQSSSGVLVSYDLYLGDSVICRVVNNWKKTIKIKDDGYNTLWARTESKEELPINIKPGHDYYIRCSVGMGLFVGHPKLELVDEETGEVEFQSVRISKAKRTDVITLNDGREIECIIKNEDPDNIYFAIFKNGKEIDTRIAKSEVKNVKRSE